MQEKNKQAILRETQTLQYGMKNDRIELLTVEYGKNMLHLSLAPGQAIPPWKTKEQKLNSNQELNKNLIHITRSYKINLQISLANSKPSKFREEKWNPQGKELESRSLFSTGLCREETCVIDKYLSDQGHNVYSYFLELFSHIDYRIFLDNLFY